MENNPSTLTSLTRRVLLWCLLILVPFISSTLFNSATTFTLPAPQQQWQCNQDEVIDLLAPIQIISPNYRQAKAIVDVMCQSTDFGPITIRWLPAQQAMTLSHQTLRLTPIIANVHPLSHGGSLVDIGRKDGEPAFIRAKRVKGQSSFERTQLYATSIGIPHWHLPYQLEHLAVFLDRFNLSLNDVFVQPFASVQQMEAAFNSGNLDSMIIPQSLAHQSDSISAQVTTFNPGFVLQTLEPIQAGIPHCKRIQFIIKSLISSGILQRGDVTCQ